VVAPITTTIYPAASQLPLGLEEGLSRPSAANCDNIQAVEKSVLGRRRVGAIAPSKVPELDAALRFALQIR
jgi:mRNA-degrading endonuclease toxin of MazEF toxin-antitoxin module